MSKSPTSRLQNSIRSPRGDQTGKVSYSLGEFSDYLPFASVKMRRPSSPSPITLKDKLFAVMRPTGKSRTGLAVRKKSQAGAVRANDGELCRPRGAAKVPPNSKGDLRAIRRPTGKGNHLVGAVKNCMNVRPVRIHDHQVVPCLRHDQLVSLQNTLASSRWSGEAQILDSD